MGILSALFGRREKTDFKQLLRDGAAIIDVRTPIEFLSGHIQGSQNIPLDTLERELTVLKKKYPKVITCCRSGQRSAVAVGMLSRAGISAVNGGSWNKLGELIAKN